MKRKISIFIATLVVAIVAMGSVSATEDVTADVTVPTEEISVDDVVENTGESDSSNYIQYTVTTSSDLADISTKIGNGTYTGYQFNFEAGTYNNFTMNTGNNNKFVGNGANIISGGENLFTVAGSSNIVITGFNMTNAAGKAAVYGANVVNFTISENVINGGKDGINIFQTYEGATITGNTISGVTRDAISLVNHKTFSDSEWATWSPSTISGNVITGGEYGMFFGGNFKGTIGSNNISGTNYGMEFAGKRAATNGRLNATISENRILNVTTGISMNHPDVILLNITGNIINTTSPSNYYSILAGNYFAKNEDGEINVINTTLNGIVSTTFIDDTDSAYGNSGTGGYSKP